MLLEALKPCRPVVFLNTDLVPYKETNTGSRICNIGEATIVSYLVMFLLKGGLEPSSIGVISPYRYQLKVIEDKVKQILDQVDSFEIEINTVDKYQV